MLWVTKRLAPASIAAASRLPPPSVRIRFVGP